MSLMTKDRFPVGEYHKSSQHKIGPYEVVQKTNDNGYKLKLSSHIRTSNIFNVEHLIPYRGNTSNDKSPNSRVNFFEEGGTDVAHNIALKYLDKRDKLKVYKRNCRCAN
ncbi:hypothetical protein AMTRI_Chr04g188260 [Amborella trichopoda]